MQFFYSQSDSGFYVDEVHGQNMPPDAVPITETEHAALLDGQSDGKLIKADAGGRPFLADPPPPTLDEARAAKLSDINEGAQMQLDEAFNSYPEAEQKSWPTQEREARAWLADNAAPTPMLNEIATARGLTLADLCARVVVKADAFAAQSGAIFGKRQAYEDQLNLATSLAEVDAITPIF